MYVKRYLWSPSGEGRILRILSYENDSSFTYSWKSHRENLSSTTTFIRHYNPNTDSDKILLICKTSAEIISTSLSVDHRVMSFTIWNSSESVESRKSDFELITKQSKKFDQFKSEEFHNARPIKSHSKSSLHSSDVTDENVVMNSLTNSSSYRKPYHKGVYKSCIAQVWPTTWSMKFTTSGKLLQRATFTNYLKQRTDTNATHFQYKVLLIMHKESIVLYNLILKNKPTSDENADDQVQNRGNPHKRYSVEGKPSSELVAKKMIWSQWDASTQRLYFITASKQSEKSKETIFYQLVGYQFCDASRHKVLEIEVDLGLSRYAVLNKIPSSFYHDLDPAVSSKQLNIRVCLFEETGSLCLCWQELPSCDVTPEWTYSIAVLDKDIVVRRRFQVSDAMLPVTFATIGQNLLVHQPGCYVHIYDVEAITCDHLRMANGLYHMYLPEDYFSAIHGSQLEYLVSCTRLDEILQDVMENLSDSGDSSASSSLCCHGTGAVCFDRTSKSFVTIQFDPVEFTKLFSHDQLTIQNKIFLTRQAVFSARGHHSSPQTLVGITESILRDPTDPSVTGILSQLLIANTRQEISLPDSSIPTAILPLFPMAVPTGALHKMISLKDQHSSGGNYTYINTKSQMEKQIELFVDLISTRHKPERSLSQGSRDKPADDDNHMIVRDLRDMKLWFLTLRACKCGSFSEYDLESIQEAMSILQDWYTGHKTNKKNLSVQLLPDRLTETFKRDFMETEDNAKSPGVQSQNIAEYSTRGCLSIVNQSERDTKSEHIMVLTSEKLGDHLFAHYNRMDANQEAFTLDLARVSRDYVYAQLRAAHHTLTILCMAAENRDRPLYSPASSNEQNLLFGLNQFQLACHITCFPLPSGFHTLLSGLTFCCLLARHTYTTEEEDGDVTSELDVRFLNEQFFDHVNKGLIRLTEHFVQRALRELGDKEMFNPVVDELLKHVISPSEDNLSLYGDLLQWRHHEVKTDFIKGHLEKLYESKSKISSSQLPPQDGSKRTRSTSLTFPTTKEQNVASYLKEMSGQRQRSYSIVPTVNDVSEKKTGFPPLDAFLHFIRSSNRDDRSKTIDGASMADLTLSLYTSGLQRGRYRPPGAISCMRGAI